MSKVPNPMPDEALELVADRFKVLGDPVRLRILQALRGGERSVGELVEATGIVQTNVSRHLQILLRAGLVGRRKEGLFVYYRVADPTVLQLCDVVCGSLAERFARDLSTIQAQPAPRSRTKPR
jgi:DNA-binding transcriptional ArsR family regulator